MFALFNRADHPNGWGYGMNGNGTAHGYVFLAVECTPEQLEAVKQKMQSGFKGVRIGWSEWWSTWYGGRFDFIGTAESFEPPYPSHGSVGDNRYTDKIKAEDVLGE